jgi:NAD(P)-dependent dehydrogenase (short-subunit alcohol dehydrogenase family)
LGALEESLAARGVPAAGTRCDTSSEADVQALAQFALDRFGRADVVCNNAGVGGIGDAWIDPMELWERVVGINLYGVVHGIRAFLPIMTAQGGGHIVNTASMAGLGAMPGAAPYNATKHAVVGLSEGLYLELKATGSPVEVSVLCPGWVKTRIMERETTDVQTPMANLIGEIARDGVENQGMDPSEVADQVVEAIRSDQFWILTHEADRNNPVERMQRAAAQINPTL